MGHVRVSFIPNWDNARPPSETTCEEEYGQCQTDSTADGARGNFDTTSQNGV
jgi:hypothetical protein